MAQTLPDYNWILARSTDLVEIGELDSATARSITPQLNASESATFTLSVLDKNAPLVQKVSTCLKVYRNGTQVWSGPVWTKASSGAQTQMQVGCVGWFEMLNHRVLKCGSDPDAGPTPTTTATSMQYTNAEQCSIAADLLSRTIFDGDRYGAPNYVMPGLTPVTPWTRNITLQIYSNIGQEITTLSQLESGFDFRVDPITRQFNMYYNPIWPVGGPYTVNGRGQVRPNALWGFKTGPANLSDIRPTEDADKIENEVYAVGQYGTGEGVSLGAIESIGLFSVQTSISDQVSTSILESYATAEAMTNAYGITVYSFDQLPTSTPSTLEPFVDFDVGDFGYLMSNYGSIVVPPPNSGFSGPQPVRIFAFTVNLDDEGNESVTNFQTVFTSAA